MKKLSSDALKTFRDRLNLDISDEALEGDLPPYMHPGEDSPATNPTQFSNWPQSQFTQNSGGQALPNTAGVSRPRSAVLVITREDGGIIGA
jgi:pyruvate dehydrogenase complex dehydrogenase (E1) component